MPLPRGIALLVVLVVLASVPRGSSQADGGSGGDGAPFAFVARGPISIARDQQFTAENGVRSGSGTPEDPYVIEGWWIANESGPNTHGIHISGVRRHVIVRYNLIEQIQGNGSYGVRVDQARNVTVEGNHVRNATGGIGVQFGSLEALRNTVLDVRGAGVEVGWSAARVASNYLNGTNIGLFLTQLPQQVTRSEFRGNHVGGSRVFAVASFNGRATFEENRFEGGAAGAFVFAGGGIGIPASEVRFARNNFLEVPKFALNNSDPSADVEARENYWGHPSGPSGEGPGQGAAVVGRADFEPWAVAKSTDYTNRAPRVDFRYRVGEGRALALEDATVDDDPLAYEWDPGDGSARVFGTAVSHAYAAEGTYEVTHWVTDRHGRREAVTRPIVVSAAAVEHDPVAGFSYAPEEPGSGESVAFEDVSFDPDGEIVSWSWDFGDGTRSTDAEPTHSFGDPGPFVVRLTVTDDDGRSGTQEVVVQVGAPPPAEELSIHASATRVRAGSPVTFEARGGRADITAYAWDLGDGNSTRGPRVTKTYALPGNYTVRLVGATPSGDPIVAERGVEVVGADAPFVDDGGPPDAAARPLPIALLVLGGLAVAGAGFVAWMLRAAGRRP